MNIHHRRLRLMSFFVVLVGAIAMASAPDLAGDDEEHCTRCLTKCPENVQEYCSEQETAEGKPCGTDGFACDSIDCQGKPVAVFCLPEPN